MSLNVLINQVPRWAKCMFSDVSSRWKGLGQEEGSARMPGEEHCGRRGGGAATCDDAMRKVDKRERMIMKGLR